MPHSWEAVIDDEVNRRFEQLVQLRRYLHARPEVSGNENQTSLHLYTHLGGEGLDVRLGPEGRGVVADLAANSESSDESRLLAVRADIDALSIDDQKQVAYRSTCPGVMHACGHDVHAAIMTGVLVTISSLQQQRRLPCHINLRGVFQPAEETSEGARQMIAAGCLDGVDSILAAHVDPSLRVGRIGLRSGVLTANCDEVRIRITGRGGHAARPHHSRDPIAASAQLINAVYVQIPRVTDSRDAVVVTIGMISGGNNSNVIPEFVDLRGTMRTLDDHVRDKTVQHIRRIADGIAKSFATEIEVEFHVATPSVNNDQDAVSLLEHITTETLGPNSVKLIRRPSMGGEDFAFYLQQVPGAMLRLGCATNPKNAPGLHTPLFDIDEEAIRVAVRLLCRTIVQWFNSNRLVAAD